MTNILVAREHINNFLAQDNWDVLHQSPIPVLSDKIIIKMICNKEF